MRIAIFHLGTLSQILPATSLIRGIEKYHKKYNVPIYIDWIFEKNIPAYLFKYNKKVNRIYNLCDFLSVKKRYDLLINLCPFLDFNKEIIYDYSKDFIGFDFDENFDKYKNIFLGYGECHNLNIFQLYFSLAKMTWKGEGYEIQYFPRSRRKDKIGISVANSNLRSYIIDRLQIGQEKQWMIPYRKNIFKKMDLINQCEKIITDDIITMHLALSLRKYVYFLETYSIPYNLEFFGFGQSIKAPPVIFQ